MHTFVNNIANRLDQISEKSTLFFIITYKIFIDIIYCLWIAKSYSYIGMTCSINLGKICCILIVFLLTAPLMLKHCKMRKSSDFIMFFFDFMYFIPGLSYISFKECSAMYIMYYCAFYFLLIFVNECLPSNKKTLTFSKTIAKLVILVLVLLTCFYVIRLNGFNIKLDLNGVYETRAQYANMNVPTLFVYLKNPMANILPILVYVCLKKKKYIVGLLFALIQLALYSLGANKINLFFLLIAIAMAMIEIRGKILVVAFWGLMIVSIALCCIKEHPMDGIVTDMLIRRMMILPNYLSLEYFNYFQENELLFFRTTLFDFVGSANIYDKDISYIIGEVLGTGGNMNNGLAGDAYANLGIGALLIYPVLFFVLFWLFNFVTKNSCRGSIILSALIIAIIYIDSNFFTSIFTHGVALILAIHLLLPKEKGMQDESKKSNS